MEARRIVAIAIAGVTLFLSGSVWADVPAPPVNQTMGMQDVFFGDLTVPDDCVVCHPVSIPASGDHHGTAIALARDCTSCHGDIVDDFDDGHYIPTYDPSLVTPWPSAKLNGGDPQNSIFEFAGSCAFCHDDGDGIYTNEALHHNTGFGSDGTKCEWCHDSLASADEKIRRCQDCHGANSLHNIQADSPNPATIGIIVIGGEDAGYGHVGRDAGPGDSDCWGCHGFAFLSEPEDNPDLHHNLYGTGIPSATDAPYGAPGDDYTCLSCHDASLGVERDCSACHTADNDGDGVLDVQDNCPLTPNSDQTDTDMDEIGDACDVAVIKCDMDSDYDIDRVDIMMIFGLRGTYSPPSDPLADLDDNGIININDARGCVLRCTLPRCAIQ